MLRLLLGLLLCMPLGLFGCSKKAAEKPAVAAPSSDSQAGVKLLVVVVDDPDLAVGINLLRGEWAERSGGELEVQQWSRQELLDAEDFSGDVVVYPTRYLGALVERKFLRQVRKSVLQDEQFNFLEVLPLVRNRVLRYGNEIYALSLGEPPLMLAWEGELPPEIEEGRSITWGQYDRLGRGRTRASSVNRLKNSLAVELIVRAVGYSIQRGDVALLFDPQTMEPQFQEQPFVRALHDLVQFKQKEVSGGNVSSVCLSWPTAVSETVAAKNGEGEEMVSFFAIPLADEVYDRSLGVWSSREEASASPTFLGFSGRLASVSRASRNAVSAFKLLKWLTSGDTAIQVSQRSSATIWFRESQISQAAKWLGGRSVSDGTLPVVSQLLSGRNAYVLPRIPGIDQYLESLDKAVAEALLGDLDEKEALRKASSSWQVVTEGYGKWRQQEAYRRHLGFDVSAK